MVSTPAAMMSSINHQLYLEKKKKNRPNKQIHYLYIHLGYMFTRRLCRIWAVKMLLIFKVVSKRFCYQVGGDICFPA